MLLWAIVASGIAVTRLPATRDATPLLQLSWHAVAVGAALTLIIILLGPVSGAHLNPVVSLAAVLLGHLPRSRLAGYVAAQLTGGVLGVAVANITSGLPAIEVSARARDGWPLVVSEVGSTLGLVLLIFVMVRTARTLPAIASAVGAYITIAIVLTPSAAFANPAVTFARTASDTYTGIAPASVGPFVGAQVLGALAAITIVWRAWRGWDGRDPDTDVTDPHDDARPRSVS